MLASDAMAQRRAAGQSAVACAEQWSAEWLAGAKERRQAPRLVSVTGATRAAIGRETQARTQYESYH